MPYNDPDFIQAFIWANEKHRDQLRPGTRIPYISHLMSVAALTMEAGGDQTEVIAALLHDVIEDCEDVEKEDVAARFGDRVARIVVGLSDASAKAGERKPPWKPRKEAYLDHLRHCDDRSILLVSNADKLHNARCILSDLQDPDVGHSLWNRFASSAEDNLWYYGSLSGIFTEKAVHKRLASEFARVVETIRECCR